VVPRGRLAVLGGIALAAFMADGAIGDWSAIYLRMELGTSPANAAYGFATFSLTMALGRLSGDRLVTRFSPAAILAAGAVLGSVALAAALLVHPAAAVLGFAAIGLALANIAPIVFQRCRPAAGPRAGHRHRRRLDRGLWRLPRRPAADRAGRGDRRAAAGPRRGGGCGRADAGGRRCAASAPGWPGGGTRRLPTGANARIVGDRRHERPTSFFCGAGTMLGGDDTARCIPSLPTARNLTRSYGVLQAEKSNRSPGRRIKMRHAPTDDSQTSKAGSVMVLMLLLAANVACWWAAYVLAAWLLGV
jgi:hypothetical protein